MTGKILIIVGTWLLSDAIYSITLYLNSKSYDGQKQTWKRDHFVRVIRAILAILIIVIGLFF